MIKYCHGREKKKIIVFDYLLCLQSFGETGKKEKRKLICRKWYEPIDMTSRYKYFLINFGYSSFLFGKKEVV